MFKYSANSFSSFKLAGLSAGDENTPPADPDLETFNPEDADKPVNMTQAQLNDAMGKVRAKFRTQAEEALKKAQEATSKLDLTAKQREEMEQTFRSASAELQGEVEKKKTEIERLRSESAQQIKDLTGKLEAVTTQFHSTLIDVEVHTACEAASVVKPSQMKAFLRDKIRVVPEVRADGKATGKQKVVVFDENEQGEEISHGVLDYIKKIDEAGTDPNLFKHSLKSGTGANNGSGLPGNTKPPKDPVELAKFLEANQGWRKQPARS